MTIKTNTTSAQLCLLPPSGSTFYQSLTREAIIKMPGQSLSALDAFLLCLEPAWSLICARLSACLAAMPLGLLWQHELSPSQAHTSISSAMLLTSRNRSG